MGERSKIEWTDHTFNPWIGCTRVSPGCVNCYAETMNNHRGWTEWGPKGERKRTSAANWKKPLAWNRAAEKAGRRARVFCASLADVFDDHPSIDPQWRADLFEMIRETPWLDWQLLTKRPGNVLRMVPDSWWAVWSGNVWVGTSVEDQRRADERIPELLKIPANVRFLSCEPLLGPVDLHRVGREGRGDDYDVLFGWRTSYGYKARTPDECSNSVSSVRHGRVDWVIVGGESGPGARPCDVEWTRSLVRQCRDTGVPVFVKQLGRHTMVEDSCHVSPNGAHLHLRMRVLKHPKGGDMAEWPEDLRVREMPAVVTAEPRP